jgi:hypothetical protein
MGAADGTEHGANSLRQFSGSALVTKDTQHHFALTGNKQQIGDQFVEYGLAGAVNRQSLQKVV